MYLAENNKLKKLVIIGDKVLIKPLKEKDRTSSGLYLPQGFKESEPVQRGYVMKTGPGYALPVPIEQESWKAEDEQIKYIPLQAQEGDLAIFLINASTEVKYQGDKFFIVPHNAILLIEREEDLDY